MCFTNIAKAKEDYTICDGISDSLKRQTVCELRLAKLTGDTQICEEMTSPQIKERCFEILE